MATYTTPTIALLVIGFLVTGYLMVLRPWLAARRQPGMTLRFPIVSWIADLCRGDIARLEQDVQRAEAQVAANSTPAPTPAASVTPAAPAAPATRTLPKRQVFGIGGTIAREHHLRGLAAKRHDPSLN